MSAKNKKKLGRPKITTDGDTCRQTVFYRKNKDRLKTYYKDLAKLKSRLYKLFKEGTLDEVLEENEIELIIPCLSNY